MLTELYRLKAMLHKPVFSAKHQLRLTIAGFVRVFRYVHITYAGTTTTTTSVNGLFPRTTWVSRYEKGKNQSGFKWRMRWRGLGMQRHQLDHMQTVCTSLQTDNHTNTSSLIFYRPDALPAAQPTVSEHWRQCICCNQRENRAVFHSRAGIFPAPAATLYVLVYCCSLTGSGFWPLMDGYSRFFIGGGPRFWIQFWLSG